MAYTALIIGATGLVGNELLELLCSDPRFGEVKTFGRRKPALDHEKHQAFEVDFEDIGSWSSHLHGDVLFSTLGTTIKAAGSQEAQYRIDFPYQYETAKAAAEMSFDMQKGYCTEYTDWMRSKGQIK